MIEADVVALFPSMTSIRTARITRDEVVKSPVEFEGMNYLEISRYIAVMEHMTSGVEKTRRILPRRSKEGTKPSDICIRNKEIISKRVNTEIEWTVPALTPTNVEKREMINDSDCANVLIEDIGEIGFVEFDYIDEDFSSAQNPGHNFTNSYILSNFP